MRHTTEWVVVKRTWYEWITNTIREWWIVNKTQQEWVVIYNIVWLSYEYDLRMIDRKWDTQQNELWWKMWDEWSTNKALDATHREATKFDYWSSMNKMRYI